MPKAASGAAAKGKKKAAAVAAAAKADADLKVDRALIELDLEGARLRHEEPVDTRRHGMPGRYW